jgi:uncharacterized small protein (DUF1192 family)
MPAQTTAAAETETVDIPRVEVFRAGDYGEKGIYTKEALEGLAADYSSGLHAAPVTIDHKQDGPAYGWVTRVYAEGARLFADLAQVPKAFADIIRAGALRNRSAEIYRKFTATGRPYLKAVTFLGAQPPHIKGMEEIEFSDHSGWDSFSASDAPADNSAINSLVESIFAEIRKYGCDMTKPTAETKQEAAMAETETPVIDGIEELKAQIAALMAEVEALKAKAATSGEEFEEDANPLEKELAAEKAKSAELEAELEAVKDESAFSEFLAVNKSRLTPAIAARAKAVYCALPGKSGNVVVFSETEKTTLKAGLLSLLSVLPENTALFADQTAKADADRKAKAAKADTGNTGDRYDFSEDPDGSKYDAAVRAFAEENKIEGGYKAKVAAFNAHLKTTKEIN